MALKATQIYIVNLDVSLVENFKESVMKIILFLTAFFISGHMSLDFRLLNCSHFKTRYLPIIGYLNIN